MKNSSPAAAAWFDALLEEAEAMPWPELDPGVPIYIYGAGNMGRKVARVLQKRGVKVAGFLDRGATPGSAGEGVSIRRPDSTEITPEQRRAAQVVIGIFNRDVEICAVVQTLRDLGFARILTFFDFHASAPDELGPGFWLGPREVYRPQRANILAALELFQDETSRALFQAALRFRLTGDHTVLPSPDFANQYFPPDLPPWPSPLRFVDCGAYDGDTVRELARRNLAVEALAAFEPDPANFERLAATARDLLPNSTACLYPCGVDATTRQLRFAIGQGEASRAADEGGTVIQCVALDDALAAFRPNVIKMDIEGAEVGALHGARRVIEAHRPGLALSVYHRAEHLWSIPLLVHSWLAGGRHFLRAHGHTTFDLIHYWMP